MNITHITSINDFENLLAESDNQPVLLFKHSTRCPVSFAALDEFHDFVADYGGDSLQCAQVDVIRDRQVSNAIAATLDITHQSPQAILIFKQKPVWNASHSAITQDSLSQAIAEF
jgi:bacillithiol system protein YtxJ